MSDFDPVALEYDFAASLEPNRFEKILAHLPKRCVRALDVGCGSGLLVVELAKRFETVVGIDVSPAMLEIARAKRQPVNVQYFEMDANRVTLEPPFDFICSLNTFHHLENPKAVVERLLVLLAPEGVLVLQDVVSQNPTPPEWVYRVGAMLDFPKDVGQHGLAAAVRLLRFRNSRAWLGHLAGDVYLSPSGFREMYSSLGNNPRFPSANLVVWKNKV
jgi:2-polyprenyl-3-methyl-5-hydroxy-6-metoxy-1,4-benzoquinol methylase